MSEIPINEEYLTSWMDPTDGKDYCVKLRQGHCGGCRVLPTVGEVFRWQCMSPEEAARKVAQQHCPQGLTPDVSLVVNTNASHTMGQSAQENTDFTGVTAKPKGRKLHKRY